MAYKVRIEVGKGKNKAVTESIPLPNKKRVCDYIKRSPLELKMKKEKKNLRKDLERIPICENCRKICNYHYEEQDRNGWDWISIPYSDCCGSEIIFYDNLREVILANLN